MTIKWRFEYTNIGDCWDNNIKLSKNEKMSINPSSEELNLERYEKDWNVFKYCVC